MVMIAAAVSSVMVKKRMADIDKTLNPVKMSSLFEFSFTMIDSHPFPREECIWIGGMRWMTAPSSSIPRSGRSLPNDKNDFFYKGETKDGTRRVFSHGENCSTERGEGEDDWDNLKDKEGHR